MTTVQRITAGILGILASKKGTFSLIILLIVTIALFASKVNGNNYVAIITIIQGIFLACNTAVDWKHGGGVPDVSSGESAAHGQDETGGSHE